MAACLHGNSAGDTFLDLRSAHGQMIKPLSKVEKSSNSTWFVSSV